MRFIILLLVFTVSGCATSAAGLLNSPVEMRLNSDRSPQQVAVCTVDRMKGDSDLRDNGTNWWVIRSNGYGIPTTRWDFRPDGKGGSIIELRTSININSGDEHVRVCAG